MYLVCPQSIISPINFLGTVSVGASQVKVTGTLGMVLNGPLDTGQISSHPNSDLTLESASGSLTMVGRGGVRIQDGPAFEGVEITSNEKLSISSRSEVCQLKQAQKYNSYCVMILITYICAACTSKLIPLIFGWEMPIGLRDLRVPDVTKFNSSIVQVVLDSETVRLRGIPRAAAPDGEQQQVYEVCACASGELYLAPASANGAACSTYSSSACSTT
jgi:hypothetical protein